MPEISRFFGIIIAMFYREHFPPHFHAQYGEFRAGIRLESLKVFEGDLPPRALGMVIEWASLHKKELLENWKAVEEKKDLKPIEPLK
jgi:hypothetical protein